MQRRFIRRRCSLRPRLRVPPCLLAVTLLFSGFAHCTIFTQVYDVSYGGAAHYGAGCAYHLFVGRDASRALAKMSFDQENLDDPSVAGLSESEWTVLRDWAARFDKKGYRVVGTYPTC
jgi:Cytochrome b5-like Heme/Steroid binding domain